MDGTNLTQRILVFYAGAYAVADESTGAVNSGTSVSYYMLTDLKPIKNADGSKGLRASKGSVSADLFPAKFPRVPGVYDAAFTFKVGSNGKPVLAIEDLYYVGDIGLSVIDRSALVPSSALAPKEAAEVVQDGSEASQDANKKDHK